MKWAVRIKFIASPYRGDGKRHRHTTKWYEDSNKAWDEADKFQINHPEIDESSSSLIHKDC